MRALRVAEMHFRAGVVSYVEVLDAQRQLFAAEVNLENTLLERRITAVQLYRALGGGWSLGSDLSGF